MGQDDNGKWEPGPTLSDDQLTRWKLTRAEQRAATAELRQQEAVLRAWIASQPEAQAMQRKLLELEKAMQVAVVAEGKMRKSLEEELGLDLSMAQVNLETGETRVPPQPSTEPATAADEQE